MPPATSRIAALLMGLIGAWGAEPAAATVSAEGLRIVHSGYKDQDDMRPFNWFPGTSLALRLVMPAGGIVTLDREASAVAVFADDLGTDLLAQDKKRHFHHHGIDMSLKYANDGTACLFEVVGDGPPAHGATRLHVQGTLAIDCATQKKTVSQDKVALIKGAIITLGSLSLTLSDAEPSDDGVKLGLQGRGSLVALAAIRFLGADGKEIESSRSGSSTSHSSFTKDDIVTLFYDLKGKPAQLTVSADLWMDLHRVSLPFDVTVGVGL